jgi:hypothetical protein
LRSDRMNEVNHQAATSVEAQSHLAQAVRDACVRAALEAYERASSDGLCCEGAWEIALDAVRALKVEELIRSRTP